MYLTPIKTLGIEAFQATFDDQYPTAEFQGLRTSLEYPIQSSYFPMVWTAYHDSAPIRRAGIAYVETADPVTGALTAPFARWRFFGTLSFTCVALTSLECDRVYDEVVRVIAFGQEDPILGRFKGTFEENALIAATCQWDEVESTGDDAQPGTPWGTDEIVYERTLNLDLMGEFVPDPVANTLVPLSQIQVVPTMQLAPAPVEGTGFSQWH